MCVIWRITFMMVKKGKLNIHFVPEYHISSKNMCFYLINIVKSIKMARNHRFSSNLVQN